MTTTTQPPDSTSRPLLRLWPGVVAALLLVLLRFAIPSVVPGTQGLAIGSGLIGALLIVGWWMLLSRAPWLERGAVIALMGVAFVVTSRFIHVSLSDGMMGMMFPILAVPTLTLALVAWAVAGRHLADRPRRVALVATMLLASGGWTLVRTDGITGEGVSQLAWRWTTTAEARLLALAGQAPPLGLAFPAATTEPGPLARAVDTPTRRPPVWAEGGTVGEGAGARVGDIPVEDAEVATAAAEWPGFRGVARAGIVTGVRIATDWSQSPPVERWRRPIGPGWSSFAVRGRLLYTQEQRGDDEVVAGYDATTGELVWSHRDPVRFWESNGGAGPRATPTVSGDRVYAFGATGILNVLDALSGDLVWSRDATADTGRGVPDWGFASSPLVVDDVVIVHAGTLVAYDRATGAPRWVGPARGGSYSSPHLVTLDGVPQVLMLSGHGATSVTPDGTLLWDHAWPGSTIVQPALIASHDVLVTTSTAAGGVGVRRIAVTRSPGGWTVAERWTSRGLKPYFNDFVVHEGHVFGFDGHILACIDVEDGARRWKGGRYGHGQLLLLADQDLLLVLSEDGDLALVRATADRFTEVARVPAIEGKTWNHPVMVGDLLLVRNDQEMAAFRVPLEGR